MPLGVISRVSFGFWGDFWRKIAKRENQKNLGSRSVGNPRHDVALRRSVGCLVRQGRGGQIGTPQVRRGEGLRRSITVLRRGVATVHSGQILDFCFRKPRIRTLIA